MKRNKKFTLIELVIVLGIIALIAMFVVPKVGAVRDNAKNAGVDTNMRMVQAYVNSVIHNFDSAQASLLESEIANNFPTDSILNPFTKAGGVKDTAALGTGGAVVYSATDNTESGANAWVTTTTANLKGSVVIAAYPNPDGTDTLSVLILPLDKNGKAISSKKTVVSQ